MQEEKAKNVCLYEKGQSNRMCWHSLNADWMLLTLNV